MSNGTVIALNAALVAGGMIVAAATPKASSHVAVLVAPGSEPAEAVAVVARAGGEIVAPTGRDWAVVARSDDADFVTRLYAAGALVVVDALLAAGCRDSGGP